MSFESDLMARYFIELSYKGTQYHGWQIQKNATGVQHHLNRALSLKLGKEIETTGSGRTDRGVHALQQFAHFDYDKPFREDELVYQLNQVLPRDISVNKICSVNSEAHARFDAISRSYVYKINQKKDPFLMETSCYHRAELNIDLMNEGAAILETTLDFESFSKVKTDVNHFRCTITRSEWIREADQLFYYITADRFLRGMVRALVGTMLDIGSGKITLDDLNIIINSRDRKKAGRAVPAHGLFLLEIKYPDSIFKN